MESRTNFLEKLKSCEKFKSFDLKDGTSVFKYRDMRIDLEKDKIEITTDYSFISCKLETITHPFVEIDDEYNIFTVGFDSELGITQISTDLR